MKTSIEIKVELSKEQFEYLKALGYYIRAAPGELLVALGLGAIDAQESLGENLIHAFSRDLLNYVEERRVPGVAPDVIGQMDSGEFTCSSLRGKREKLDRDFPSPDEAHAPALQVARPAAAGNQQQPEAGSARPSRVGLQPCPGLRASNFRDSMGRNHDLTQEKPISAKDASRDPRLPDTPRRVLGLVRAGQLYPVRRENARVIRIYPSAIADYWARQTAATRVAQT